MITTRARAHTHTHTHTRSPAALWSPHKSSRKKDLKSYCGPVKWCFIFDSFCNLICYFNFLSSRMCHVMIQHFKNPSIPLWMCFINITDYLPKQHFLLYVIEARCFFETGVEFPNLFFRLPTSPRPRSWYICEQVLDIHSAEIVSGPVDGINASLDLKIQKRPMKETVEKRVDIMSYETRALKGRSVY